LTLAEVAQQKRAADLLDDVLAEIFPTIREGETEREVHARVLAACTRRGAAYVHGILNSSSNDVMYGGESDVSFRHAISYGTTMSPISMDARGISRGSPFWDGRARNRCAATS
jgi:Xaa-Pro aminopeptidase